MEFTNSSPDVRAPGFNAAIWDYAPVIPMAEIFGDLSNLPSGCLCPQWLPDQQFLTYFDQSPDKTAKITTYNRRQFWDLVVKAIAMMTVDIGLKKGDRQLHYFSGNTVEDLVLRTACVLTGSIPVTVNWQSDLYDQICYKLEATEAKAVFVDSRTPHLVALQQKYPQVRVINAWNLINQTNPMSSASLSSYLQAHPPPIRSDIRCVIFTSGTTGHPKGVQLSYNNYSTNRLTFESFLDLEDPSKTFVPIVVNPMHHTNSTSISDWALRRPNSRLYLFERYSTQYWSLLASVLWSASPEEINSLDASQLAQMRTINAHEVFIAPLVSRHIDFLEGLMESSEAIVGIRDKAVLGQALARTVLLLGSAPVGPTTTQRLLKYANRLPTVRFGSTETTLQVCGIPARFSNDRVLAAFERGWKHTYNDEV